MSIRAMTRVWDVSKAEGAELLIMLALADWANDDGYCWPAMQTLAKKARIGRRYAQTLLKKLEEMGEVCREGKHGRAGVNLFHVTPGGDLQITPGDDLQITPPMIHRSPDPSLDPSTNEPSVKARKKRAPDPRSLSPEIQSFRELTNTYPIKANYDSIITAMSGRTIDEIRPYWEEWCARGYNPRSIKWLVEWVPAGPVPTRGTNGTYQGRNGASRFGDTQEYSVAGELPPEFLEEYRKRWESAPGPAGGT